MNILTLVNFGLLWILFFWFWRDYRVDRFRENLFSLRDSLFDLGVRGIIDFDSPAYGMLRGAINGTIRNGHKVGLLEFALFLLVDRSDEEVQRSANVFHSRWFEEVGKLPDSVRNEMTSIRTRLHLFIMEQIVLTSALLMVTFVAAFLMFVLWILGTHLPRWFDRLISRDPIRMFIDHLDNTANVRADCMEAI